MAEVGGSWLATFFNSRKDLGFVRLLNVFFINIVQDVIIGKIDRCKQPDDCIISLERYRKANLHMTCTAGRRRVTDF